MATLDIDCSQSFSFALPCTFPCKNSGRLFLGCGYQLFLFFKIPYYASFYSVKRASLILFKTPDICMRQYPPNSPSQYFAYPLLELYSPYGCIYGPPVVDEGRQATFYDTLNGCSTEVDITNIVRAWIGDCMENKGLVLTASEGSNSLVYASDRLEFAGMNPMLRLVFENIVPPQPLSVHDCDVALHF